MSRDVSPDDGSRGPDDAAWEQIVASIRGPDSDGGTTWPEAEDLHASDGTTDRTTDHPEARGADDEPIVIWRGSEADIDAEIDRAVAEEHFEPPEPPPLPKADAITWAAWAGVIGSPLLLLLLTALGVTSRLLVVGAVAGFLAGVVVLVLRMRTHRDPFDPDDGAVV